MATLLVRCAGRSALAICCAFTTPLLAQTSTLVGLVRDSSGHPIPGVEVWLRGLDLYTHTNDNGGFRLQNCPVGAVKVTVAPVMGWTRASSSACSATRASSGRSVRPGFNR